MLLLSQKLIFRENVEDIANCYATWQRGRFFLRIFADISLLVLIELGFGKNFVKMIHSNPECCLFSRKIMDVSEMHKWKAK